MIIGIDAKPLTIPFPCGLKTYAQNLILALSKIDKANKYILFSPKTIDLLLPKNFEVKVTDNFLPWQIRLPLVANREKIDIFHLLQQHGSFFLQHPKMIVTVHDYSPLSAFPKWHESGKYFFYRYYVYFVRKSVINRSRAIISVSDFTKKEIIKRFKKKLILTIPEGIDLRFKKLSGYKSKNYFLAMADFSPRKNIIRVLKSYSLLPYDIKLKYKFKIVVSMDYPIGLIMQFTRKSGITNYVSIIKSPSNGELVKKYNRAFCFIYPSLYEGFGLPILEAMACGCPVITSNFDPMKEIAGNAAVLVNPYSVEEIRSAMENIINDQNLREKLIKNGNNRIRKYSWEKTAKQTLNFYEKIYRS